MTDEEIHNIYLHMSGKAEGLVEANGTADFPVLFARAILEYEGLTKDMQNMASKSTYKEQLEAKDEPVAWGVFEGNLHDMFFTKEEAQEMAKLKGSHAEIRPLYTKPQREYERGFIDGMQKQMQSSVDKAVNAMTRPTYYIPSKDQREWVGLTDEEKAQFVVAYYPSNWDRKTAVSLMSDYEKYLKERNT